MKYFALYYTMIYNDYFQDLLRKTNFSVKTIADKLGVSIGAVYKWKSGENRPQKHHVNKLAELEKQKIKWLNNEEIKLDTGIEKKGDAPMDNRLQKYLLDEIESLKALNIELTNQVRAYESSQGSVESFARELDASSTFKEIAENLNIKSRQWDYVFDNMHHPLAVLRGNNIIRSVNNEFLRQFGYEKLDMMGKLLTNFIHPDDADGCAIMKNSDSESKCRVLKKNGKYCEVRCRSKSFGSVDNQYNLALIECIEKDCPDCT